MARVKDVGSCAGRPRTARSHIGHDRYRRGEYRLDDIAHGGVEAAGGIHLEYDDSAALVVGVGKRVLDIPTHGGRAGTVELDEGYESESGRNGVGTSTRCRTQKQ